ncbi:MAG: hypothetical protein EBU84_18165 [Actinobacteria bacterium]|nr:hypothetical protein [Actinomycetota bacterium]
MAIQLDIQNTQFGVPFAGAYFRVVTAAVTRQRQGAHKFQVMIDAAGYGTSSPTDDTQPVDFRRYHAPLEDIEAQAGDTFLAKCYAWLMMQDSMSGAVAV